MEIAKDCFVVIEYDLRLDDGTFIRGENGPVSMNFIVGYCQVLPGLESRLLGLSDGTQTEFVVPAREAFGEYDKSLVRALTFDEFPAGRELQSGKWATAKNPETGAQFGYFVSAKTDSSVTLDHNHPLAGKSLQYRLKVVLVREASNDELEYLRPCEHGTPDSSEH